MDWTLTSSWMVDERNLTSFLLLWFDKTYIIYKPKNKKLCLSVLHRRIIATFLSDCHQTLHLSMVVINLNTPSKLEVGVVLPAKVTLNFASHTARPSVVVKARTDTIGQFDAAFILGVHTQRVALPG
jgi:hypothetical protein